MTGRTVFKKAGWLLVILTSFFKIIPRFLRVYLWNCTFTHSQLLFVGIRYALLRSMISECGENVKIADGVRIEGWKKLRIGNNVSVHSGCYIDATGGITIGNNVSIAHHSTILSSSHSWTDSDLPIKYNPLILRETLIDDDVWIGCACRILGGVKVKSRSIVAAGAIVTSDIENNSIYAGVPAKVIRKI